MRVWLLVLLLALGALAQETRSFLAVRTSDGVVIAEQDPDRLMVPASTLKILTAARAREREPFETSLWYDDGVLILKGGGDPTLTTADLHELAGQVKEPVTAVEVDAPDLGLPYGPGWAWEDQAEDFQPEICGLTVNGGLTSVTLGPQGVSLSDPTAGLCFRLRSAPGNLGLYYLPSRPAMLVTGLIEEPLTLSLPVPEPDLWAGRILAGQFGDVPVQRGPARGAQVARHRSESLEDMLRRALATSDNLVLEMLWRQLPSEPTPGARIVDGNGLSRYNLVSARMLVAVVPAVQDLLPGPGEGTLKNRFSGLNMRAKTGSMGGVTGLTGVLHPGTPDEIVFAVLTNGALDGKAARQWEEDWLRALDDAIVAARR